MREGTTAPEDDEAPPLLLGLLPLAVKDEFVLRVARDDDESARRKLLLRWVKAMLRVVRRERFDEEQSERVATERRDLMGLFVPPTEAVEGRGFILVFPPSFLFSPFPLIFLDPKNQLCHKSTQQKGVKKRLRNFPIFLKMYQRDFFFWKGKIFFLNLAISRRE